MYTYMYICVYIQAQDALDIATTVEELAAEATAKVWLSEIADKLDKIEATVHRLAASEKSSVAGLDKEIGRIEDLETVMEDDGWKNDDRWKYVSLNPR